MTEDKVNDTIIKMVTNLKSSVEVKLNNFEFNSPLKRPLSSNSNESQTSNGNTSSEEQQTPLKKFKQEHKFDMNYMGSPREIRRIRADLIEARNTIMSLEKRVQHMHNVRKEMQIMFDNETKSLERQHEHDRKSIEDLENQLQSIRQREVALKEELAEVKNSYNLLKVSGDEKVEELERTICEYKESSRIADFAENNEILNLNRKISELKMILEAAEEDAEAQRKLAVELEKRLAEKNTNERDLELKDQALHNAKLRIKELEYARENYLEFQEQAKTQAYKLSNYADLEKENERLKQENVRLKDEIRNKLVLEEEVNDLRTRLQNFKDSDKKLASVQMQQVQTETYLNEWRAVARGVCETTGTDSSLPHLLRSAVERLQQQEINLTSAKVELESQLNATLHECKLAKSELEKNQKLVAEMKKNGEQKQNLIHRMQKKLLLVSRERDSYRLQLDLYEKDLTMCVNPNASNVSLNQLQTHRERIENLEHIVEGYREMVSKLESDLQNIQPIELLPVRAEQISRLQDEINQLRIENEKLTQRKDQLEIQLEDYLVGHDSLQGGNVYHLTNNPLNQCLAQREQLVERLQEEVDRLKRKIKNMEDGLESSKLSDSAIVNPQEVQSLKDQIKSNETQIQRLKDCFKSSMQEFRNVIYMLLGYKVDRTSNSLYKLTSIYAESAEHHLCFQVNSDGALNLLENEFSATLDEMVNLHLRHQKSIPVFLSAITMDLFNSRTLATKTFQLE